MGFDDEVDEARRRLEQALQADDEGGPDPIDRLASLLPQLQRAIQSRRLAFAFGEEEDEDEAPSIEVVHLPSDEVLGFVFVEGEEFVFESNLEEYFDDFVDEDAESFIARLYECLRADLPKYEVEMAGSD